MNSVGTESSYPLSPVQQGILFHSLYEQHSGLYIQQLLCTMHKELDVTAFVSAWEKVIERHPTLRTSFRWDPAYRAIQEIHPEVDLPFEQHDWRHLDRSEQETRLASHLLEDRQRAFEFGEAPLMRFSLFRFGEAEFRFVWTSHHALFDGRSRLLLLKEVSALYEHPDLKLPVAREYRDYVEWLDQKDLSREESFWREELRHFEAPTTLPISSVRSHEGHNEQKIRLTADETSLLQAFAGEHGLTLNSLLQGAWALLLSRYSGDEDVLFGTTRSCRRSLPGADSMIGLLINTVPFRVSVPAAKAVLGWLKELRAKQVELREYEHTPLVKIQEWCDVPKGLPLFESLVVFENYQLQDALQAEATLWQDTEFQLIEQANYPLSILGYAGRELLLKIAYDQQRFDETTIAYLLAHLRTVLLSFVNNPEQKLREIELLTREERKRLVVDWNKTTVEYPEPRCVHELFEEQAERTPNAIAIKSEDQQVSYHELDSRANQLAHHLLSLGIGPEQLLPVCVERSVEMVVALLAVMKAGGAYVPIDPEYPRERIQFVLEETAAKVILTQRSLSYLFSDRFAQLVHVDDAESFAAESKSVPANRAAPENLVYVIYTSGSTGRPKGVMVEHSGLRNLCEAQIRAFDLKPGRQQLQFASLSFDASASEIFTALLSGATLHLVSKESLTTSLLDVLRERAITTVTLPPSLLAVLPNENLPALHTLISAGEACSKEIAARWAVDHRFLNAYGPTEVSVCATMAECDGSTTPPLGNPIDNAQVYLLDLHFQPVPVGVPGELYVGGAGLARGYLGSPELTATRFVPNPFSDAPGARLYKTGDLARVRSDGQLEYIGRIDHQIKVRGYRIELTEIEAVLSEHPALQASLVLVREDKPGNKQLVAYCVARPESSPATEELRDFLGQRLPAYMLPAAFVLLDAFPLTPNGKIDRRALPSPDFSSKQFIAPRNDLEETVASIWAELLRVERVGVNDNFFELGGNSLLAMQLFSRLRETLELELPLRSFFDHPTVGALARHAQEARSSATTLSRIAKFERYEPPLASFAQQRLWLLDQLEPGSSAYNISRFLRLSGPLEIPAFEAALTELLRRHESLRTTFGINDGQPRQIIAPPARFELPLTDLSAHAPAERETIIQQLLQTEAERPFDLARGPLFRAALLRLSEHEHVFQMNMHHIVSDGWSMMLFFKELSVLYAAALHQQSAPLPELPIQYADYALWQREWLSGERLQEQLEYWRQQLETAPAVLELPTDYPRPVQQSYHGHTHELNLEPQLVSRLKQLSQQSGCTLFMTLVAAFKVLLYRYTGSQDILVGTPVAGRNRGELEDLIGFFVNTLVLRTDLSGNITFRELLGRVREVCLGAYAHQDLPFEKLVEELHPERSLAHMPLYQVMFTLLEVGTEPVSFESLETTDLKIERRTTKSDLTLSLAEHDDGSLAGSLHYRDELFHADTIRRLANQYERLLHAILDQPASRLADVDLVEPAERRQLLEEWTQAEHDPPPQQCFHELFELQVERRPNATAVKSETVELSYNQLNSKANQLAHYLLARGVGREQPVGICVERSPEMIVALLAVMKAGATYVPIDPDFPQQRISFILEQTRAQVVLTRQDFRDRVPENVAVCLDTDWHSIGKHATKNPNIKIDSACAAYIIYTSGSTGRAKGVVVEHRQLVSYTLAIAQQLNLEPGDKFAFLASFAADLGYTAIFPSLCNGGTLCVLSTALGTDAMALSKYLHSNPIDHLKIVPSQLRALLDLSPEKVALIPKKRLVLGGEASSWKLIEEVERLNSDCRIVNHYGPTETTVGVLTYNLPRESPTMRKANIPLGRPLPNTEAYILDSQLTPVPIRTPGELYIGGNSLARGYIAAPDLTAERFIPHPFSRVPGARLYRTGDNARYLPDGNIEYLGRSDHQVKLRGFRVELGEIEVILARHPSIREAVVMLSEAAPADQRLVAYFVPNDSADPNLNELRAYLRQTLPEYMIPSAFVSLEKIPRTSSGKVDRRALPVASKIRVGQDFVEPRTPIEKIVAGVFSQTLKVEQVGAEDNFFELGGHSLLAMQVVSRLREMLRVEVPLRSFFEAPTVAELSTLILAQESTTGQTEKIARIIMRLHDANPHPPSNVSERPQS